MAVSIIDLEALAETCLAAAKSIKAHLTSTGQPQMSFDQNGPSQFPAVPVEIQNARSTLQMASKALYDLVTGPSDYFAWTILSEVNAHRAALIVSAYLYE